MEQGNEKLNILLTFDMWVESSSEYGISDPKEDSSTTKMEEIGKNAVINN